jgi:hypothetical protein
MKTFLKKDKARVLESVLEGSHKRRGGGLGGRGNEEGKERVQNQVWPWTGEKPRWP